MYASFQAAGTPPPCYVNQLLDEYENSGKVDKQHEEDIRCIGAVIYSAGVETTEATISTFMLMMTLHPEVAARAQAEIDRVCGTERLPAFEDRARLPYIDCIMKEVFRLNPAVPIGIPHESTKTDVYRGWTIPSGSMVLPNIWNMMRDEKYYPEPETFSPDRFVKAGGDDASDSGDEDLPEKLVNLKEDDPNTIVFGFGRRCVFVFIFIFSIRFDFPPSLLCFLLLTSLVSFSFPPYVLHPAYSPPPPPAAAPLPFPLALA